MKKFLLAVFLCSGSVPLLAQQGQTGVNGLHLVSPLQIGIGQDNNFLVDRTDLDQKLLVLSLPPSVQPGAPDIRPKALDDQFFLLTLPKIAYQNDSRRHEFTATWVPEFEMFKHNSDQNAMNQQAVASFGYSISRNLQVAIGDTYRTSKDPARTLSNVFLLLPRSRYHENTIHGAIDFQTNALTNFAIRYDGGYSRYGQTDPFQARILDSTSNGFSFAVSRMLRPNQRLRATYSVFTITPINQRKTFDDAVDTHRAFEHPISSGTVEYRIGLDPNTILEFGGGAIKLDTGLNYTLRGNFYKRFGFFWVGGGYLRTLAFQAAPANSFAQAVGSNGFYDVIVMNFRGQPTRRTAVLGEATLSRDVANRIVNSTKALMGRARFDYRLSDRNVLFFNWDTYQQSNNVYVRAPLSRNRFMMGVEISLSGETQRRINRLNEDAQYVALTDHARRTRAPEDK